MAKVLGIVLAGGRSSRMGQDKAELLLGGQRMIDRVVENISSVCSEGVRVAGRSYGYPVLVDALGVSGPMAAIAALGTLDSPADWFFVIPVDMPAVDPTCALKLLENFGGAAESCDAAHFSLGHMPLILKNDDNFRKQLKHWLSHRSSDSVKSFLKGFRILEVAMDSVGEGAKKRAVMVNLNFQQDYQAFVEQLAQSTVISPENRKELS